MKVITTPERCIGSGQCVVVADAVFDQDDDGVVVLLTDQPTPDLAADVRAAANICPGRAIRVEGD